MRNQPSPSAKLTPPLDFDRLQLVAETEKDKSALLTLFFRMANDFIVAMEHAQRDRAFQTWKAAVHSLKGSAGNLGMAALEKICQEAEKMATHSDEQRNISLTRIRDEVLHIRNYLADHYPDLLQAEG